tara:strand:+ start:843 stop:1190 length:348 start_codon:yes stop_codon:yes gene_type:complete
MNKFQYIPLETALIVKSLTETHDTSKVKNDELKTASKSLKPYLHLYESSVPLGKSKWYESKLSMYEYADGLYGLYVVSTWNDDGKDTNQPVGKSYDLNDFNQLAVTKPLTDYLNK